MTPRSHFGRALLVASLTLLTASAAVAQLLPAGPEFQVNSSTAGKQLSTIGSVAIAPNGGFVVVWTSTPTYPGPSAAFGQRFDATGSRLGGEFLVSSTPFQGIWSAYVAADPVGNFVVVWGGGFSPDLDIHAQRFDAGGTRRGGEFRVNTWTTGNQYRPKVAADSAGNFVVVWHSDLEDNSYQGRGVFAQRYDASGTVLGNPFRVNTYTTHSQAFPAIDSAANGDFVVAWHGYRQDGSGYDIFAQRYLASGVPRGAEFRVNTYTTDRQWRPVVAADAAGRFVIVWMSTGQDGAGYGVFGQRYDAAGVPLGPEFQANTYTTSNQGWPGLDVAPDGDFIVNWSSLSQDGSIDGVFGRHYDNTGAARGGEFQINSYTTSFQIYPGVAAGPDGRFVVVWDSYGQDGSAHGVFGQRFASDLIFADGFDPQSP